MKLRIKGNSLRLRLSRSEVQGLMQNGDVAETTCFGESAELVYAIRLAGAANAVTAEYAATGIIVTVPTQQARQWAESDLVGIYNDTRASTGGPGLTLMIEKDFACLDRDDPEDADAFPNPKLESC